jgi:hypothetical protein
VIGLSSPLGLQESPAGGPLATSRQTYFVVDDKDSTSALSSPSRPDKPNFYVATASCETPENKGDRASTRQIRKGR